LQKDLKSNEKINCTQLAMGEGITHLYFMAKVGSHVRIGRVPNSKNRKRRWVYFITLKSTYIQLTLLNVLHILWP